MMAKEMKYDIFTQITEVTPVVFENGELKQIERRETYSSGCRVILNDRVGFSSTTIKDDKELIERSKRSAEYGREIIIELPEPVEYESPELSFKATEDIKTEDMVDIGVASVNKFQNAFKNPDVNINVELRKNLSNIQFMNSEGIDTTYRKCTTTITFFITRSKEGDLLWLYDGDEAFQIEDLKIDQMVDKIIDHYEKSQNTTSIKTGTYPVIMTPYALPQFLVPFTVCINGENIEKGISILKDKKGEKIFDSSITIIDDQLDKRGTATRPFDGEGLPSRRNTIVENGILKSYIHTLSSAHNTNDQPTSNASRSGSTMPSPSLTNLRVGHGEKSKDELIESIDKGILVYFLSGVGQSNTLAGEFQNGLYLGYLIEDGKIKGRLKNVMLSGNLFDVMKNIGGISKEIELVYGDMYMPYIMLNNVSVAGG
ncbi:MAG: hypothetical protein DRH49_02535 [Candidatus Coatesbacteria bacterium]|nr:MAG: hypothetical protein DRH49_02535 [Candidatus Coatesbacteria bacterium]